jgi:hypothetical protein
MTINEKVLLVLAVSELAFDDAFAEKLLNLVVSEGKPK